MIPSTLACRWGGGSIYSANEIDGDFRRPAMTDPTETISLPPSTIPYFRRTVDTIAIVHDNTLSRKAFHILSPPRPSMMFTTTPCRGRRFTFVFAAPTHRFRRDPNAMTRKHFTFRRQRTLAVFRRDPNVSAATFHALSRKHSTFMFSAAIPTFPPRPHCFPPRLFTTKYLSPIRPALMPITVGEPTVLPLPNYPPSSRPVIPTVFLLRNGPPTIKPVQLTVLPHTPNPIPPT